MIWFYFFLWRGILQRDKWARATWKQGVDNGRVGVGGYQCYYYHQLSSISALAFIVETLVLFIITWLHKIERSTSINDLINIFQWKIGESETFMDFFPAIISKLKKKCLCVCVEKISTRAIVCVLYSWGAKLKLKMEWICFKKTELFSMRIRGEEHFGFPVQFNYYGNSEVNELYKKLKKNKTVGFFFFCAMCCSCAHLHKHKHIF